MLMQARAVSRGESATLENQLARAYNRSGDEGCLPAQVFSGSDCSPSGLTGDCADSPVAKAALGAGAGKEEGWTRGRSQERKGSDLQAFRYIWGWPRERSESWSPASIPGGRELAILLAAPVRMSVESAVLTRLFSVREDTPEFR